MRINLDSTYLPRSGLSPPSCYPCRAHHAQRELRRFAALFGFSVNAEDIHLGPMVNGEGLTHGPLADQLALGFVHDPGQRDLGCGDIAH